MMLSVEQAADWLNDYTPGIVYVEKNEQEDTDLAEIRLERVEVRKLRAEDPDDYTDSHALTLQGRGTIRTDAGEDAELPSDVYEIPVTDKWDCLQGNGTLHIKTERADYSIRPQSGVH